MEKIDLLNGLISMILLGFFIRLYTSIWSLEKRGIINNPIVKAYNNLLYFAKLFYYVYLGYKTVWWMAIIAIPITIIVYILILKIWYIYYRLISNKPYLLPEEKEFANAKGEISRGYFGEFICPLILFFLFYVIPIWGS